MFTVPRECQRRGESQCAVATPPSLGATEIDRRELNGWVARSES